MSLLARKFESRTKRALTLSRRWVNSDSVVQILLRRAHFQRNREALDDLVAAETDDVNADDLLLWAGDDELVDGWLLLFFLDHGEVEGAEGRFVWWSVNPYI